MFDADYPATVLEKDNVQAIARNLGLEVEPHETRRAEDIAPVFDVFKGQADARYVVACSLFAYPSAVTAPTGVHRLDGGAVSRAALTV
jgi:hypothetical protein